MFGSPKIQDSYEYWGGIAQAVCLGPVTRLFKIKNGDTVIWDGPLESTSMDGDGKSVISTTIGSVNFYWGTANQNPDAILAAAQLDSGSGPATVPIPRWPYVCYATGTDIYFGTQKSPPVLTFELEVETAGLGLSDHDVSGDGVIPEIIYNFLTNTVWGAAVPVAHVDAASFVTCAETLIDEGLGVSPTIDATQTIREIIGKLLQYVDGVLFFQDGKIHMKLVRAEDTTGLPEITSADMLEEPQPVYEGPRETWNVTSVSFTDRENNYETSSEIYDDPANAASLEQSRLHEVSLPFIKRRQVAKQVAKLIGIKGGLVPMSWTLMLKPSWSTLNPGDLAFVTYTKLGMSNRLVRVTDIDRGTPEDPSVRVTVLEESTRDTSHDYVPDPDVFSWDPFFGTDGGSTSALTSTTPRLSWLPDDLKPSSYTDGFLVACERPDNLTNDVQVWWTWDPGQQEYRLVERSGSFPAKGTLLCWHRIGASGNWLLRVQLDALNYEMLTDLMEGFEVYAVVGERKVRTVGTVQDQHQVMALWAKVINGGYADLLTAAIIDLEVDPAQFGTNTFLLETIADPSNNPTVHIYFGSQEDFLLVPSRDIHFERNSPQVVGDDTDLIRYIKTPVSKPGAAQAPADVTAATYDRDDTTMCPDGTLSRTWGDRALSTYEYLDIAIGERLVGASAAHANVQDLDAALGAIYEGTATADQVLLADDIDTVLGAMVESADMIYNDSP
jgi:hypothetical protein